MVYRVGMEAPSHLEQVVDIFAHFYAELMGGTLVVILDGAALRKIQIAKVVGRYGSKRIIRIFTHVIGIGQLENFSAVSWHNIQLRGRISSIVAPIRFSPVISDTPQRVHIAILEVIHQFRVGGGVFRVIQRRDGFQHAFHIVNVEVVGVGSSQVIHYKANVRNLTKIIVLNQHIGGLPIHLRREVFY